MSDTLTCRPSSLHSSVIDRITAAHQKNKEKELRVQKVNTQHLQ